MRPLLVLALLGLFGASVAVAQEVAIRLETPWVRRAPAIPGAESNAGGYVTIVNRGPSPDALVGATADVAERVELHETRSMSGVMMMEPVAKVEVAPGTRVELRPGSYHLMLIGLKAALKPGQTVTLRLRFERAGALTARATVR